MFYHSSVLSRFTRVIADNGEIVKRNFSILSPKLVLAYAENILSNLDRKIVQNANLDDASL